MDYRPNFLVCVKPFVTINDVQLTNCELQLHHSQSHFRAHTLHHCVPIFNPKYRVQIIFLPVSSSCRANDKSFFYFIYQYPEHMIINVVDWLDSDSLWFCFPYEWLVDCLILRRTQRSVVTVCLAFYIQKSPPPPIIRHLHPDSKFCFPWWWYEEGTENRQGIQVVVTFSRELCQLHPEVISDGCVLGFFRVRLFFFT